jgi:hypothetical protein
MRRLIGFVALAVVMGFVPAAMAQSVQGNLFLTIADEQGSPIEGAQVVAQGADFARTLTSDDAGRARFINLYPGQYDVTVSMDGFNTMILRGIQVDIGASPEMSVAMQASQLVEEVVVTAQTPVMDQRNLGTSTVYSRSELEQVPQARDPWSVISSIPGVTVDRVNVAGSEAGQQAGFVGKGDDGDQSVWLMDGVEFTDVGAIGGSATYLDFNSFEQIGFATAGANFELQSPGVQMEFVTKQGSNRVTGTARLLYAEADLQGENNSGLSQPAWVAPGTPIVGNQINENFEKNFDIGGPLVKDNLWFWLGFTQNDINVELISGQADVTKLRNTSMKLHGQFLGKGSYKVFYTNGDKIKDGRGGGIDRPPETTWEQSGPTPIYGASIGYFFTPNLEVSLQASHVDGKFSLLPKGDFNEQIFFDEAGVYHNTYLAYDTVRPQDQVLVKGNFFFDTGSWDHELKFGYRYKTATVDSLSKYSNFDIVSNKFYPQNYVYLIRELNTSVDHTYNNLWVGDTVLKGPWTLSLGFNFSSQTGEQAASKSQAVGLAPSLVNAADFEGFDPGFDWTAITPRAGATYTFDWEHRLMLRASFGQYVDQLSTAIVSYNLPLGYTGVRYDWDDANDNDFVDWDDQNNTGELVDQNADNVIDCLDAVNSFGIDPCNTGASSSPDLISPDLDPPLLNEFIAGIEYEVGRDFTIGANYTFRSKDDMVWRPYYDPNGDLTPGGAQPFVGTDAFVMSPINSQGTAPDGTSTYDSEFWVLTPQADSDLDSTGRGRLQTNNPGYKQEFNGLEIVATKRLSNKWRMRAFVMYSEWQNKFSGDLPLNAGLYGRIRQNSGDPTNYRGGTTDEGGLIAVQSTSSGNKVDVFAGNSTWQFNVNGLYQLPMNWSVSGNVYARQGYGLPYYSSPDTSEGVKNVQNGAVDDLRYDDLFLVDLRVAKTWLLGTNTNVELAGELFNATNANTTLQLNQQMQADTFQRVGEIVSPRVLRIVASVNF